MKHKLIIFVLSASLAAFAQHGGGMSGGHMGGAPSGAGGGAGMGSMGADRSGGPAMHGPGMGNESRQGAPSDMGKQSPETILQRNTKLASNLDKLLPNGETAQQACSGFKNLGQCVAAIHVSHNLGISFDQLKDKMTTGSESLGKAIQDLSPNVNAKAEAKKANKQATQDFKNSAS